MYQNFYHFIQKPFDVTPDPRFLYMSSNHEETLAAIIYGIRERRGFITIIGEVGTGKTLLLNATLERLDKQTASAFIFNTDVTFEELLHMALIDFGLATADESLPKFVALDRLNRFATEQFADGKNIVIFIDEAQNLNLHAMENLRLLSNLETTRYKLVQIVLSGQPELDEKLRKQEMRQLAQRINLRRYITPLDKTDTYQYVRHHLKIAGCSDPNFFDKASLALIWAYSGGVPRKINILCDNALLIGYGLGKKKITRSEIQEAIRDLSWSPFSQTVVKPAERKQIKHKQSSPLLTPRLATAAAGLIMTLILGVMAGAFWGAESDKHKSLPSLSKQLWANATGTGSPETPGPKNIRPDTKNQNAQIIPPKPESPAPDAARKSPTPGAVSRNQTLKTDRTAQKTDTPKAILTNPSIEPRQPAQTAVNPQIETPSPALREKTENQPADEPFDLVVVRKGDSLSWIIEENKGDFEEMLPLVLQANAQIRNPNLIMPGWVIRLPRQIRSEKPVLPMTETKRSVNVDTVSRTLEH